MDFSCLLSLYHAHWILDQTQIFVPARKQIIKFSILLTSDVISFLVALAKLVLVQCFITLFRSSFLSVFHS